MVWQLDIVGGDAARTYLDFIKDAGIEVSRSVIHTRLLTRFTLLATCAQTQTFRRNRRLNSMVSYLKDVLSRV